MFSPIQTDMGLLAVLSNYPLHEHCFTCVFLSVLSLILGNICVVPYFPCIATAPDNVAVMFTISLEPLSHSFF